MAKRVTAPGAIWPAGKVVRAAAAWAASAARVTGLDVREAELPGGLRSLAVRVDLVVDGFDVRFVQHFDARCADGGGGAELVKGRLNAAYRALVEEVQRRAAAGEVPRAR